MLEHLSKNWSFGKSNGQISSDNKYLLVHKIKKENAIWKIKIVIDQQ